MNSCPSAGPFLLFPFTSFGIPLGTDRVAAVARSLSSCGVQCTLRRIIGETLRAALFIDAIIKHARRV